MTITRSRLGCPSGTNTATGSQRRTFAGHTGVWVDRSQAHRCHRAAGSNGLPRSRHALRRSDGYICRRRDWSPCRGPEAVVSGAVAQGAVGCGLAGESWRMDATPPGCLRGLLPSPRWTDRSDRDGTRAWVPSARADRSRPVMSAGATPRRVQILLFALLLLAPVACAPNYRIVVSNRTANGSLVRLSSGAEYADFVYALPPGTRGATDPGGGTFDGRVELLNGSCEVIESVDLAGVDPWLLVTFSGDHKPAVEAVEFEAETPLERVSTCQRR